ncbi:MAG: NYN domain-containing protein, partial [Propionibacteriaceae bacterium]|nr:NYN domain-containing protein [Propionibacteriaceae bacterium]
MKVILPVVQFTNCTGGDYLRPKAERVRLAQVVLFIDYQNTYRATRACFHDHATDPAQFGQIWPLSIGQVLVNRSPFPRELSEVRVYRGLPSSHRDPKAYGAARRQNAAWTRDPEVHVISRPIRYPPGYPTTHAIGQKPTEKGIDVSLAVDFVTLAVQGKYDIGILMSLDTDLIPALEFVHNLGQA